MLYLRLNRLNAGSAAHDSQRCQCPMLPTAHSASFLQSVARSCGGQFAGSFSVGFQSHVSIHISRVDILIMGGYAVEVNNKTIRTSMKETPRSRAIRLGKKTYHTGKPCINGHIAERHTLSAQCVVCALENMRASRAEIKRLRKEVGK